MASSGGDNTDKSARPGADRQGSGRCSAAADFSVYQPDQTAGFRAVRIPSPKSIDPRWLT
jgi:hypothetical protein